jgi:hypothetical protein
MASSIQQILAVYTMMHWVNAAALHLFIQQARF